MDYRIITRNGESYVSCTCHNGHYYELPVIYKADGTEDHDKIADAVVHAHEFTQLQERQASAEISLGDAIRDDVYMGGVLQRHDYSIEHPEGRKIADRLVSLFPNEPYLEEAGNLLGSYDVLREPYKNDSISLYHFDYPSDSLLAQYGLPSTTDRQYRPWYGRKFDLVTKEVMLKVVLPDNEQIPEEIPRLGVGSFFAKIYHAGGTSEPMIDCYGFGSSALIRRFCNKHNLQYPLADEFEDKAWIWGAVYNLETKEISHMKGYIRNKLTA